MGKALQHQVPGRRLLGWLIAGVMASGVVSAGVVGHSDGASDRVVNAAGVTADGVEAPTTTAVSVPVPIVAPTTALPPLPFVTSTAPATATAPRPTTRAPTSTAAPTRTPATTTTTSGALSSTTTTAGLLPADVMLTIDNGYSMTVAVTVNDRSFTLTPDEHVGPVAISRHANGNDTVAVAVVGAPSCGYGATDHYFGGPGTYDMTTGVHLGPGFETGCPTGLDVGFVIFKD